MKQVILICGLTISVLLFTSSNIFAQFYIGPYVGFKASGLKGAGKTSVNGQVSVSPVADAGSTGFTAGATAGYQVIPPDVTGGLYKLDLALDISWASFNYFENGYNSVNGSGSFSADGLSGGKTNTISIDIMPINRFNIKNFILSPYAGIGLGINLLLNGDISITQNNTSATLTGHSDTQLGLLVFYGTLFNVSEKFKPFIQFIHLIPFGSETQFTDNLQIAQGGGSTNYVYSISDVPGYFSIVAGVRFEL